MSIEKSGRPEVKGQSSIENKVTRAKLVFTKFLYSTAVQKSQTKPDLNFSINFDNMAITLNLSDLPPAILQAKMDEVVLAVPGMTKTSFIPQQAKVCGYEMKDLITLLIESVR